MNHILETLLNKRSIWQGRYTPKPEAASCSGYAELDQQLQGGIPKQGVIDLQSDMGIGELRLLLPYLRDRHKEQRILVYIAPPMLINGEMLSAYGIQLSRVLIIQSKTEQENLWSAEQCLKSGCCHSVLLWQKQLQIHQVKRLQLAAQKGGALQVLFRPLLHHAIPLPTTLSLQLDTQPQGVKVTVNKRKGGWHNPPFEVNMQPHWPELTLPHRNNVVPFSKVKAI